MKFVELMPATAFRDAIAALPSTEKLVVCGSPEDREYIEEGLASAEESIDSILARASEIDVEAWFSARHRELETGDGFDGAVSIDELLGTWPSEVMEKPGFSLAHDMMSGELHTSLVGAKVPAKATWHIPAHFHFGGWNECPEPALHCAIWRYWLEKYGAQLVAVSNDVIEAYVERPPQTEAEAIELAWQQYLYCADIVEQGVESVANLAASLINHNVWFFWWD